MADDSKPWEDASLKGAYNAKKQELAQRSANFVKNLAAQRNAKKEDAGLTGVLGQASKLEKRNRAINAGTKPLRKLASGTEE